MKLFNKNFIITFLLLFVSTTIFAMTSQDVPAVDLGDANTIVGILTPLVTLGVVWVVKKITPLVTGTVTLVAVPVLAGLITLVTNALVDNSLSTILQILLGTGSVFLHQLYEKLTKTS